MAFAEREKLLRLDVLLTFRAPEGILPVSYTHLTPQNRALGTPKMT